MIEGTVCSCLIVNKEIATLLDLAHLLANAVHVHSFIVWKVVNSYLFILIIKIDIETFGKS